MAFQGVGGFPEPLLSENLQRPDACECELITVTLRGHPLHRGFTGDVSHLSHIPPLSRVLVRECVSVVSTAFNWLSSLHPPPSQSCPYAVTRESLLI